jgi:OmcA/MtrC family decaheme c-type cytochrome
VTCHVPGLATSGRGISDTFMTTYTWPASDIKKLGEWGMMTTSGCGLLGCTTGTLTDPDGIDIALGFPVTSNNMKDMIHGIHAGRERASPFRDARDSTSRGVVTLLDLRRMDFPGVLNNCEGCHVTATAATTTYNSLPGGVLASTYESINATYLATPTVGNAAESLKTANPDDTIVTPFAASCASCHDGAVAKSHMDIMGAKIGVKRLNWASGEVESCAICHGPGADFDTVKMHK